MGVYEGVWPADNNGNVVKIRPQCIPGFVYLIQAVKTRRFKIGLSRNVLERIKQLQECCPFKLRYVYHAYVLNMREIEVLLHNKFQAKREIGEWFTFAPEDVKACILSMRLSQVTEENPLIPVLLGDFVKHDSILALPTSIPALPPFSKEEAIIVDLHTISNEDGGKKPIDHTVPMFKANKSQTECSEDQEVKRAALVLQFMAKGWGKQKIIFNAWGVRAGGSQKYKTAETEYKHLIEKYNI